MKKIRYICIWNSGADDSDYLNDIKNNHETINEVIVDQLPEVVYNLLGHSNEGFSELVDICNQYNIPITMLATGIKYNPHLLDWSNEKYRTVKAVDYSQWWITKAFHWLTVQQRLEFNKSIGLDILNNNVGFDITLEHLYVSMNNLSHKHRCEMMDTLAKYKLIELGAVSWRDIRRKYDDVRHTLNPDIPDSVLDNYPWKHWEPKRIILDVPIGSASTSSHIDQSKLPRQYAISFMQLVVESHGYEYFFLTEKTATPLFMNKPFLVASCKHFHKNLTDMGFKLYDELFDYSFDNEDDYNSRITGVAENIDKYRDHSIKQLEELRETIKSKLKFNRELALDYTFNRIPKEITEINLFLKKQHSYTQLNLIEEVWQHGRSFYD